MNVRKRGRKKDSQSSGRRARTGRGTSSASAQTTPLFSSNVNSAGRRPTLAELGGTLTASLQTPPAPITPNVLNVDYVAQAALNNSTSNLMEEWRRILRYYQTPQWVTWDIETAQPVVVDNPPNR